MTAAGLLTLLVYVLVICLIAYVVVVLLQRAGLNGTIRMIVYAIAALIILVILLNTLGIVYIEPPVIDAD